MSGPMRLKALGPSGLSPEQRAVYDAIVEGPRGPAHIAEDGSLRGPFNAMLYNPTVGGPLQELGAALRYDGCLPPVVRELATLTVAAAFRAEFEWHAHSKLAAGLGVDAATLETIRTGGVPTLDDEAAQTAVELVRLQLARADVDDATYDRAVRILGEDGLFELTVLVGYYSILAAQLHLFRVPLPAGVEPVFPAPSVSS